MRKLSSAVRLPMRTMSGAAHRVGKLHCVRVGGVPEHFCTPWHTCAAKGLFNAAGLDVEWTDFPGGTGAMTKALRAGEIDVALALTEGLVADLHRGNPSKLLGTFVASPLTWGVHVRSGNQALQSMADLDKDATYAVSRMGSGSHLMACVDAHARGIDPQGLLLEVVGSLDGARKALREEQADIFMWGAIGAACGDRGESRSDAGWGWMADRTKRRFDHRRGGGCPVHGVVAFITHHAPRATVISF